MANTNSTLSAYLVRASWADQRLPGRSMRMLYGCLAESSDEAVKTVRDIRPASNAVTALDDALSSQTARVLKLERGKPAPL